MTVTQTFSPGLVQAHFVRSSGLLLKTWSVISSRDEGIDLYTGNGLSWKVSVEQDRTVVAFEVKPGFDLQQDLVSSARLREDNFHRFEFLCTKKFRDFSLNNSAVDLFKENLQRLDDLKSKIDSSPQLIITAHGLGGLFASLFTLLLLDSNDDKKKKDDKKNRSEKKKHPLCITFGSPLVGDKKLQEAISRSSTWSSCFLHVVSYEDPVVQRLNPHTYMPFGTFLFCSDTHCTSSENPESVLELLVNSIKNQNQGSQPIDYGNIVVNLYRKAICKDFTTRGQDFTHSNSLRASICLQLEAVGLTPDMQRQQHQKIDINALVTKLETLENKFVYQKRIKFDPSKKLNLMKIEMVKLEWYKKHSKSQGIGYYDSFKRGISTSDQDVVQCQKNLRNYWKDMVEEAEMKPQTEGAAFRTRWLFGGTNYRRMVEPLEIAEYYASGGTNYVDNGRYKHYEVLEAWLEEEKEGKKKEEKKKETSKKDVELILTVDSCFWAFVEEALLFCQKLENVQSSVKEKEDATMELCKFEDYVYESLKKYEVSPEIFLKESSYMKWWNKYKANSRKPELAVFMSNPQHYDHYTKGTYDFH